MVLVLCILQQYVSCVLLPYRTLCAYYQLVASWCFSDDNTYWMLYLGLLLLNSPFLSSGLSYINTPGIFLYLLMVSQGHGRIIHTFVYSWVLLSSHFQCWTEVGSWYFWQQFLVSYIFALLHWLLFAESILFSWHHILALIW